MRRRVLPGMAAVILVTSLSGCGNSSNQTPSSTSDSGAVTATTSGHKWSVGRQLIQDLRWGSESEPENQLLASVKEAESTPDQRLVLALNDLGAWYRGQKRYDEAEKTYNRVLELQKNRLGQHFDVTYTENDLGVVLTDAGKYQEAAEHFKICLDTGEKMQSEGWFATVRNDDYAEWQHNYAVLLKKMGSPEESEKMEASALKLLADRQKAIENVGSRPESEASDAPKIDESQAAGSGDEKVEGSGSGDSGDSLPPGQKEEKDQEETKPSDNSDGNLSP